MRPSGYHGDRCASASHRPPATPKATIRATRRSRSDLRELERRACALLGPHRAGAADVLGAQDEGRASTTTRVRARTMPRARARRRDSRAATRRMECARRRARRRAAARAPTFACWPRTSATRWAAVRISRRCGGRRRAAIRHRRCAYRSADLEAHGRRGLPAQRCGRWRRWSPICRVLAIDATATPCASGRASAVDAPRLRRTASMRCSRGGRFLGRGATSRERRRAAAPRGRAAAAGCRPTCLRSKHFSAYNIKTLPKRANREIDEESNGRNGYTTRRR